MQDARRDLIATRAQQLILALHNDDSDAFEFALRRCQCEGCGTELIGALAAMILTLLEQRGGDWPERMLSDIAVRVGMTVGPVT